MKKDYIDFSLNLKICNIIIEEIGLYEISFSLWGYDYRAENNEDYEDCEDYEDSDHYDYEHD